MTSSSTSTPLRWSPRRCAGARATGGRDPAHLPLPRADVPGLAGRPRRHLHRRPSLRSAGAGLGRARLPDVAAARRPRQTQPRLRQLRPHRPGRLLHPPGPGQGRHRPRRPAQERAPRPGGTRPHPLATRRGGASVAPGPVHRADPVLRQRPHQRGLRLDVDDIQVSARKGRLRLYGKSGKFREVDIHPKLRTELQLWLDERPNWPRADDNRALFLNAKGGRLSTRAAGGIIAEIAQNAGLDDPTTAHVLRHTLATTLVRGKADLVLVAEILGHARLETTRRYSLPSDKDKEDALKLITVDR
ncbi:tyrosine-type recombinase/integrase [Nonomuraea sp. NPDC003201]